MWNDAKKAPVLEFLGWVLVISLADNIAALLLEPYSMLYMTEGKMTAGYIIYAIIGIFISTPNPMIAAYIVLKRHKKITYVKDFFRLIFRTENILKTFVITGVFCAAALCFAVLNGTRTDSPWYLFLLALPVMIIGGGVEEIGWRGFLQPELEKKLPFPVATIIVSVIWYIWHLPIWLMPSSNHYGDSLIGFGITIFVWSFIGAAIYKSTKSVFACVMYHAFINAIGAVYDWNALFDAFPKTAGMIVYYVVIFTGAIVIWIIADKKERNNRLLTTPV